MKSFEDIENIIKDSRVTSTRVTDDRILACASHALKQGDPADAPNPAHQSESHRHLPVKIAAAIVVGVGLFSWLIPGHETMLTEGLVLAEIQNAIHQQNAVFVTGTRTCVYPGQGTEPNVSVTYNVEKWASDAGYIDTTFDQEGRPVLQACYHFETGTVTLVYHDLRQYYHFHVPDIYRDKLRNLTLLGILDCLFLAGEHTNLGPDTLADQETIGFEVTDFEARLDQTLAPPWMRFFFLNITRSKARLWVSPETRLPVSMRGDFTLDGCLFSDFTAMQLIEVSDQWHWGADMARQNLFPDKPAGYLTISIPRE
ncbi:MAG: hypothetical protein GY809_23040 [Planctomycetes bacterium]|nr:hypothetical protein [Planctomycetota bacterium]